STPRSPGTRTGRAANDTETSGPARFGDHPRTGLPAAGDAAQRRPAPAGRDPARDGPLRGAEDAGGVAPGERARHGPPPPSGPARAWARLAAERGYRGETWEVAPEALGGGAGVVRITVDAGDREGQPALDRFLIRVEADYPRDDVRRARTSKTLTIDLGPET